MTNIKKHILYRNVFIFSTIFLLVKIYMTFFSMDFTKPDYFFIFKYILIQPMSLVLLSISVLTLVLWRYKNVE